MRVPIEVQEKVAELGAQVLDEDASEVDVGEQEVIEPTPGDRTGRRDDSCRNGTDPRPEECCDPRPRGRAYEATAAGRPVAAPRAAAISRSGSIVSASSYSAKRCA